VKMEEQMSVEGWFDDPYGRHEERWISDGRATALVRDGRLESQDPLPQTPPRVPYWKGPFGPGPGALIGAVCLGAIGAAVGLVVGVVTYPATAWFAIFEAGLPAGALGSALGTILGLAFWIVRRFRRS